MGNVKSKMTIHRTGDCIQRRAKATNHLGDTAHIIPRTINAQLSVVFHLLAVSLNHAAK
jgi:hypothetical protein